MGVTLTAAPADISIGDRAGKEADAPDPDVRLR
jgi:hypothetical protein